MVHSTKIRFTLLALKENNRRIFVGFQCQSTTILVENQDENNHPVVLPIHPRTNGHQKRKMLLVGQPQEPYCLDTLCSNKRKSSLPDPTRLAIWAITGRRGPLAPLVYRSR